MAKNINSSGATEGGRTGTAARIFRGLGILALSLAALMAGSYALVPWAVKSQLPKLAEAKLGRAVHIGDVSFTPWSLDLRLNDLVVAGPSAASVPLAEVASVHISAAWASFWRLAPVLDALDIEAPKIHVEHLGDGRYDFDDLVAHLAKSSDVSDKPSEPAKFALYNLALKDGSVDFVDKAYGRSHALRDLNLTMPFLSSLAVYREVKVQPTLSFNLNGSSFDSKAQSTPFAASRQSAAQLKIDQLDLKPYLPYLPKNLPVRLSSGVLDTDLAIAFEQGAAHVLRVSGGVELKGLGVDLPSTAKVPGEPLLNLSALRLKIKEVLPFEQQARLEQLEFVQPVVAMSRSADGTLPLMQALVNRTAASASPTPANASKATESAKPWSVQLDKLALTDGSVLWRDASTRPSAQVKLSKVQLAMTQVAWPLSKPFQFMLGADLAADPVNSAQVARLEGEGTATDKQADAKLNVSKLDLALANPYLAQWINPSVAGQLNTAIQLKWRAASADKSLPAQTTLEVSELNLDTLALNAGNPAGASVNAVKASVSQAKGLPTPAPLASIHQIKVTGVQLNLEQQDLAVASVAIKQVNLPVDRVENGHWMSDAWMKSAPAGPEAKATTLTSPSPTAKSPWKVAVSEFIIDDAHVPFTDKSTARPVRLDVSAFKLKLNNLVLGAKKPVPLDLQAKVSSGKLESGTLAIKGKLLQEPLGVDAAVNASRLPLHSLARYMTGVLDVDLLRADTSFKGQVNFSQTQAGPVVMVKGDAALEDFRANTKASRSADKGVNGDELLSWKALGLRGVDLGMSPGRPMQLDVRETALSDFYARLILREDGKFNLQDLTRSSPGTETKTAVVTGGQSKTIEANDGKANQASSEPSAQIRFGGISLVNGKVFFSDHFIKPNYSADLSELTGRLGAFSSQSQGSEVQMADLELRGKAEGTATLEILGKLNPLAKPLAMDIKGKVRELELPPLSAYSVKYAGHAIERGKLSLDVGYLVLPTGELTASNKLVLNSLKFGDKVEGATASLPVKLAVALLADKNGVIDLELPVSGSLNDPQFQLGSVIFKVLGNIILKAITSPFSLISSAITGVVGGGESEMSNVSFALGSSQLSEPSRQSLDRVAKVMEAKSNLSMTVVGTASFRAERDAYQRERLQSLVQAEKRRGVTTGAIAGQPSGKNRASETIANNVELISGDEYETLIKRVYRRANIVKPRNLVGLVKDIPLHEMETLLLTNMPATEDNLKELALQRAVVVKDYLASRKVPSSQLFLGAPKTVESEGKWTPHAELNLSTP